MVKVHYDKGVATHIGPSPCMVVREDVREASAGVCAGPVLSLEKSHLPGCRRVHSRGRQNARVRHRKYTATRRGPRPGHVQKLFAGNRESCATATWSGPCREGRNTAVAGDARRAAVRPLRSSDEVGEQ